MRTIVVILMSLLLCTVVLALPPPQEAVIADVSQTCAIVEPTSDLITEIAGTTESRTDLSSMYQIPDYDHGGGTSVAINVTDRMKTSTGEIRAEFSDYEYFDIDTSPAIVTATSRTPFYYYDYGENLVLASTPGAGCEFAVITRNDYTGKLQKWG